MMFFPLWPPLGSASSRNASGCAAGLWQKLPRQLMQTLLWSPLPLGKYVQTAMAGRAADDQASTNDGELYPCPPPFLPGSLVPGKCRRVQMRWRQSEATRCWINLMCMWLSYRAAFCSHLCPQRGKLGVPLNDVQMQMIDEEDEGS